MSLAAAAGGLMLLFSGCAEYAKVSEKRPIYRPLRTAVGLLVQADAGIQKALHDRQEPEACLGCLLDAARDASTELQRQPQSAEAQVAYNFALARIFSTIKDAGIDPWSQPLRVPAAGGDYLVTHAPFTDKARNPALYDFTPSDQYDIRGTYVKERSQKDGVGATLVAVGKHEREDAKEKFVGSRVYYGITAVATFAPPDAKGVRRVVISFHDPLSVETVRLGGRTFPLAADFTVPLAVMLARENPKKLELARLLQPEKYAETARIVRLQPYDPKKIVVIVVHGLNDTPATWAPMINSLRGDAFIRAHYQFWFFSHPSGYPYPYSAAIMRQELDAIEKRYPVHRPMVLIGHSMGGLISRLMVTDPDERLWNAAFGKSPAETKLSPETRQMLEQALLFQHRREVGRVIFISAPHRGSDMATAWYGRFGASLIRAPRKLLTLDREMRSALVADDAALKLHRVPNSVDTLAPNNRFVKAINTIPITAGIPYHSIIGDRGKGGNKDHTPPVSSDGIVPYWSSHLDGARSELIVPSSHSAHQNPQAIAEVGRILRLNAGAAPR